MDKTSVHDLLETMQDSKILILDRDRHDNVRLQLPFNGATSDEFPARLAENDKNIIVTKCSLRMANLLRLLKNV